MYFQMELAHSLLLNEDALLRISENKRPVFVFEWLRFLDKVLVAAQKVRIHSKVILFFNKRYQQKVISQSHQNIFRFQNYFIVYIVFDFFADLSDFVINT